MNTWYVSEDGTGSSPGCTPVRLFEETSALEDLKLSFRFPSEETEVRSHFVILSSQSPVLKTIEIDLCSIELSLLFKGSVSDQRNDLNNFGLK